MKNKYNVGDTVYFWYDDYGAITSKIYRWVESEGAYLTDAGLYLRDSAVVFDSKESLNQYALTHKRKDTTDCGYSFGCDFLPN